MSIRKKTSETIIGVVGLSLLAAGIQGPAIAQTISLSDLSLSDLRATETSTIDALNTHELTTGDIEIDTQPIGLTFDETSPAEHTLSQSSVENTADLSTTIEATPVVADNTDFQVTQPVTEAAALTYPSTYSTIETETETNISAADELDADLSTGLASPPTEDSVELAQARRRTRGTALGSDYIGIGADIGYTDDFGFAAISKFSLTRRIAIRPSVVIGDDFSVLVPITYDFSQYSSDVGGFPVRPYAGVGASYTDRDDDDDDNDDDDDSDINLLLSAGIDIPLSRRFTLNGQVNWGVLEESQFGVTVGVGYNFGNILGR